MPAPKRRAPAAAVTWRGLRRRTWLVLIVLETVALALLVTGLLNGDGKALIAAVLIGLIYAPLRAGGWTLVRRWFVRSKEETRDEAFYRRRK